MKTAFKLLFVFTILFLIMAFQNDRKKNQTVNQKNYKYVYFKFNSDEILTVGPDKSIADTVINRAIKKVLSCECKINLKTCADYNEKTSPSYGIQENRAIALKNLLISKGVPENKVFYTLYPQAQLKYIYTKSQIDTASTPERAEYFRSFNRNIEIKVLELKK